MMNDINEEIHENKKSTSLGDKIIEAVRKSPNLTIRPARLSTLLGISVDEAATELCGLLAAVGGENGATFTFEKISSCTDRKTPPVTMVFTFPNDFEKRARSYRRRQEFREDVLGSLVVFYRYLKLIVAFGLIISLLVIIVTVLIFLITVTVAMLTQQRGQNRNEVSMMYRRIQSLMLSLRELLWFYAIFGNMFDTGQPNSIGNPFLVEMASTVSVFISLCCGNPFHPSFWLRSALISRRQRVLQRRWGTRYQSPPQDHSYTVVLSSGQQETKEEDESSSPFPGLLSIAVEFLFGSPFLPEPSEQDRWRIRALLIASRSNGIISIQELLPYVDYPPRSLEEEGTSVSSSVSIIAHFNGVPQTLNGNQTEAMFCFPELVSEAECGLPSPNKSVLDETEDSSWKSLFCKVNSNCSSLPLRTRGDYIPEFLRERKYTLTKLQPNHFFICIFLGIMNYLGIQWLSYIISTNNIPELSNSFVRLGLGLGVAFLRFYSKLFLFLPTCRLLVILVLNERIERRNNSRRNIANDLSNAKDSNVS